MARWDPWRGCHKIGPGCNNCYTHLGDVKRGVDTNVITRTDKFYAPIEKKKNGDYKMKSNSLVFVCFSSDFLIEEADQWRQECFNMIKERQDLHFLFLTKRIERLMDVIPPDWGDGYDNVTVGVSVSNQKTVDFRLSILCDASIKHKNIILQPLVEKVDISDYLKGIELVVVGGEYGKLAREFHYDWVLDIRNQCVQADISFEFRQCGSIFVKDNIRYSLRYKDLMSQAKKANINYKSSRID